MAPLIASWLHFPDRKGLMSGIIMAGFGFGVFVYNFVTNYMANPYNAKPSIYNNASSDDIG